jgi:hypothetical protein
MMMLNWKPYEHGWPMSAHKSDLTFQPIWRKLICFCHSMSDFHSFQPLERGFPEPVFKYLISEGPCSCVQIL